MTGKEALADLYYRNIDNFINLEETNKKIEIIKQDLENKEKLEKNYDKLKVKNYDLKEQNAKYKRAFEILKKADIFMLEESFGLYKAITGDKTEYFEKEEYELLEELMKDENC